MFFLLFASVLAESIVETVNNDPSSTWVAVEYPASVITRAKFLARLGTYVTKYEETSFDLDNALPENFDSREQWPGKILPVRDQASCGSCWAFSVAETMGDRLSIKGCDYGDMAPQDLVSCDTTDMGCNGGYMDHAWAWTKSHGVTTEKCMPYQSGSGRVPACPAKCVNGSAIVRNKSVSYKKLNAQQMMEELYENGPISVAFTVYYDFMNYKSGVYVHKTGGIAGGHAVLCVGWGVEDNTPYWLCQNSWGPAWGEKGHFKILRGSNHCGIENQSYAPEVQC
ncbi:putative cathepsin B1 cysteine protease [Monocercomonoides exilis]|uniref:Cathepsin B1 cysteine protease n=1 Tax=Monocercomonoides sp. PA TaxID=302782 RepID=B1NHV4_9EUKA|nr:cathepsin B1 cysteine protease [Monocercomonoides sp. PA]KAH7818811.1 putative cathepsin B1 cysteine protease [Monocercomonoides exilis]|eukprot:MONOS_8872.1-p1 / transcript=MONOS_8872.1 / gene=MONOS_8872 / organism=Monocercomonoides_exilis_PA203 / gene_product=cathepsin B1 cysteine protease / transcript_product=cathepsin B1 cysteine protease / location=Mono_scaffold00347:55239-56084(-) / protein_length=281 / sequence_SO=supercontig / SO=protein_coding / is_pseudo=false